MTAIGERRGCSTATTLKISFAAALFWLIVRLAILAHTGQPLPFIHDEMSYLLGADTFAHGRLANPPLPLGRFFLSPHILVAPTYASKYPPGQALFLALGQKLFGTPFAGVILEGFAMIISFGLMFCTWVSPKWAALFSFASALGFEWPMYWVNSYWGGCLAAIGAALLLTVAGLFLKTVGGQRVWDPVGLLLGIALLLLFFSRPYEGGVLALAVLGSMLVRRRGLQRWLAITVTAMPLLAAGLTWTLYYNYAVTGKALQLPYLVYDRAYATVPSFWFLPLRPQPQYPEPRMEVQHGRNGFEVREYNLDHTDPIFGVLKMIKVLAVVLGPLLAFVLLIPFCWADDRCRFLTPILAISLFASLLVTWKAAHYLAPAIATLLLLAACISDSRAMAFGRLGRRLWAPVLIAASAVFSVGMMARGPGDFLNVGLERASMINQCLAKPGKHLVFVSYDPAVPIWVEWVYNSADLDSQRVILAHDLGPEQDPILENRYPDRTAWIAKVSLAPNQAIIYKLRRLAP